jgi:hypothetical protein
MSEEKSTYQCSLSAQDLRIGNWVYDGESTQFPMQVTGIGKDWVYLDFPGNEGGVWEGDIKDLRPIPITVEILEKAGFCYSHLYYQKECGNRTMDYEFLWNILRVTEYGTSIFQYRCCYLHQLQNTYYMATGGELQIEL